MQIRRGTYGVTDIIIGSGLGDLSSIPEQDCISYNANLLGKSMNQLFSL